MARKNAAALPAEADAAMRGQAAFCFCWEEASLGGTREAVTELAHTYHWSHTRGYSGMPVLLFITSLGRGILADGTKLDEGTLHTDTTLENAPQRSWFISFVTSDTVVSTLLGLESRYALQSETFMRWSLRAVNHVTEMVGHAFLLSQGNVSFPAGQAGRTDLLRGTSERIQAKTVSSKSRQFHLKVQGGVDGVNADSIRKREKKVPYPEDSFDTLSLNMFEHGRLHRWEIPSSLLRTREYVFAGEKLLFRSVFRSETERGCQGGRVYLPGEPVSRQQVSIRAGAFTTRSWVWTSEQYCGSVPISSFISEEMLEAMPLSSFGVVQRLIMGEGVC